VDPINTAELTLKKGDAFLFENRVFHTPAPNLSNSTAKVVIMGYSYRWMGGLKSNMDIVQPSSEIVQNTNPMCQQLLGGASNAIVEWIEQNNRDSNAFEWTMEV
jgi:ectoine hydroxylase-related dioxygenase (phytanoyl-CoA dioxygenase family)